LEKPFVSGCSFGGWVAQKYAALFPEQPAGIILIDTEAYVNQPKMFARFEAEWGPEMRAMAERYVNPNPPAEVADAFRKCLYSASKNPIPEQWVKRSILNPACSIHTRETITFSFNLIKDLKRVTAPVLYLASTINPFHTLEGAEETRDALINSEVTFVPIQDCGLVGMDAKEQCVQEIRTFIQKKFNQN
jgi:pimeloyl-ACP methyl ester carboxylesterase